MIDRVFQAKKDIEPYIITTPLVFSRSLSRMTEAPVYLKLENRQATGSFKVRGALNKLIGLSQLELKKGMVAASAGNHALGVAYAARKLGYHNLTIFVPQNCPPAKLEKLGHYPIDLLQEGNSYDEAVEAAREYQKKRGGIWISAYDDIEIITGQATIGLEIMHDLPETEVVFVPVGGGGLISGVASTLHALKPGIEVIGIQPSASPSALLSFRDEKAYDPYKHEPTIADGLAGGFGKLPYKLASKLISQILLFSECEIGQTVVRLFEDEQIIAEPSGAISIAPLLNGEINLDGRTAVCIISGGNLSVDVFKKIIDSELS